MDKKTLVMDKKTLVMDKKTLVMDKKTLVMDNKTLAMDKKKYQHKETELQIMCVRWFGYQYPYLKTLLYHPKNEGTANGRVQGAIGKAEGVVAGVADLILQVPAWDHTCLAIEMKTKAGKQSYQQKVFQAYLENAGGKYIICRSFDDFVEMVGRYLHGMNAGTVQRLKKVHAALQQTETDMEKKKLQRIVGKK